MERKFEDLLDFGGCLLSKETIEDGEYVYWITEKPYEYEGVRLSESEWEALVAYIKSLPETV